MGFSSWNHFHMGVTAPLLLDVADAFAEAGLRDAGYVYINTDDGWLDFNRSGTAAALHPSSHFTNDSLQALTSALHAKHFKFGIYLAAGFTTCGRRAGSLYHERSDAAQIAAAGVDYLKYDDCGEANIQSYAKYFVMKDALDAAYGPNGVDYYSFEPFQVYGPGAVEQMRWVYSMWEEGGAPGVLWRSGGDIRAQWRSILGNAHANNKWAPNAKPGHYNDAGQSHTARMLPCHVVLTRRHACTAACAQICLRSATVSSLLPSSAAISRCGGAVALSCCCLLLAQITTPRLSRCLLRTTTA